MKLLLSSTFFHFHPPSPYPKQGRMSCFGHSRGHSKADRLVSRRPREARQKRRHVLVPFSDMPFANADWSISTMTRLRPFGAELFLKDMPWQLRCHLKKKKKSEKFMFLLCVGSLRSKKDWKQKVQHLGGTFRTERNEKRSYFRKPTPNPLIR